MKLTFHLIAFMAVTGFLLPACGPSATSMPVTISPNPPTATPIPLTATPVFMLPTPLDPLSVNRIELAGGPIGIAKGFDSLWVAAHRGNLVYRLNPSTGEIQATIHDGIDGPVHFAILADAVWVSNSGAGPGHRSLVRIDPATNLVTMTINTPTHGRIIVHEGYLLLFSDEKKTLTRVDSTTGDLTVLRVPDRGYREDEVFADEQGLWVADTFNVHLISADGIVLRTLPTGEPAEASYLRAVGGGQLLVTDRKGFWLLDAETGEIAQIQIDSQVQWIPIDILGSAAAYGDKAFWIVAWGDDTAMLLRIDPQTKSVTQMSSVAPYGAYITSIFQDGDTLWLSFFNNDYLLKLEL